MEEQCRQPQDELSGELIDDIEGIYADYGPPVYEHYSDVQTVDKRIRCLDVQDSAKEDFYDRNKVRIIENTMVKSFDENYDVDKDAMLLSDLKEVLPGEEFLTDEGIIKHVLNDLEKLPNESDEDKLSALNITLTPAPQLPWPTFYDEKDEVSCRDDASHKKTHGIMGVPPLAISDGNVKRNLSAEKDPDSSTVNPSVPEKPLDASLHSQINVSTDNGSNVTRDGTTNITVKSDRSIGDPALTDTAKDDVREVIYEDIEKRRTRKRQKVKKEVIEDGRTNKRPKVTYKVIDEGSTRKRPKLVSSDGFSYTVKTQKNGKTVWRCSVRRKGLMCYASVSQTDDVFSRGVTQHIHPADPNIDKKVMIKRELKREAAGDVHESASLLAKNKLEKVFKKDDCNRPRPETLARIINRARQKLQQKEN